MINLCLTSAFHTLLHTSVSLKISDKQIYGANGLSTLFMKPVAEHSGRSQNDIGLLFPEVGTASCSAVNHAGC